MAIVKIQLQGLVLKVLEAKASKWTSNEIPIVQRHQLLRSRKLFPAFCLEERLCLHVSSHVSISEKCTLHRNLGNGGLELQVFSFATQKQVSLQIKGRLTSSYKIKELSHSQLHVCLESNQEKNFAILSAPHLFWA